MLCTGSARTIDNSYNTKVVCHTTIRYVSLFVCHFVGCTHVV